MLLRRYLALLSCKTTACVQAGLTKSRKQLTIETGPSAAELAAQKAESTPAAGTEFEHAEVAGESEVVRRFFQVSQIADNDIVHK